MNMVLLRAIWGVCDVMSGRTEGMCFIWRWVHCGLNCIMASVLNADDLLSVEGLDLTDVATLIPFTKIINSNPEVMFCFVLLKAPSLTYEFAVLWVTSEAKNEVTKHADGFSLWTLVSCATNNRTQVNARYNVAKLKLVFPSHTTEWKRGVVFIAS